MRTKTSANYPLILIVTVALLASACEQSPKSGRGLVLPEGDIEKGEQVFTSLYCNDCHRIAGRNDLNTVSEPQMTVTLGGGTSRVSTYGELVTSVINPSHRVSPRYDKPPFAEGGKSRMRVYNDVMTVAQLIDLTAFLQQTYQLEPIAGPSYMSYFPEDPNSP
ncbi:MAG: cytochrome C [Porticoccaceae bacterium]|nr:cytochrome C [Porticoccaceae bacterium]